jgi:prophage DNA circulation protein
MLAAQSELAAERASTSRMRVMVQERNATIEGLKKKGEELKSETHRQDLALAEHKLRNSKLEATLEHFRRHMVERESTLSDKEMAIQNLRRTNVTLDNFRFVLDHRVQQLLEERAPISNHINELEEHIDSMYDELEKEYQSKQLATQDMDSKAMKINTLSTELLTLQSKLREKENFINGIKRDLSALVSLSNPKEVEDAVKDAYQKFVKDERPRKAKSTNWSKNSGTPVTAARGSLAQEIATGGPVPGEEDSEMSAALKEAYHQRDCVEKMKNALAHKLEWTKKEAAKAEIIKLEENSSLMAECNTLRTENLTLKRSVDHLKQVLRQYEAEDRKRKDTPKQRPPTADPTRRVEDPMDPFSPLPSVTFSPLPHSSTQSVGSDSLDCQSHIASALNRAKHADLLTVKKVNTGSYKRAGLTESGLRFERAAVLSENAKLAIELEENERIIGLQKLEMNALKGGQSFPRVTRSGPTQRREVVTLRAKPQDKTVGIRGLLPGDNTTTPGSGPFSSKPAKLQGR